MANPNFWCFSNNPPGAYGDSAWDISTILRLQRYFLSEKEPNRGKVVVGDKVLFREYGSGSGFWGSCEIADEWVPSQQDGQETGWFPISNIEKWGTTLPYSIIRSKLCNKNHRLRILSLNESDWSAIDVALMALKKLGYSAPDGEFRVLESGLEEAVKASLGQLGLVLHEQQYDMGVGIGRSDLICKDKFGNYVVLELEIGKSSDVVVGQILRYMGYVRENWAGPEGKEVSGIILTPDSDEQLRLAAKEASVKVLRVRI